MTQFGTFERGSDVLELMKSWGWAFQEMNAWEVPPLIPASRGLFPMFDFKSPTIPTHKWEYCNYSWAITSLQLLNGYLQDEHFIDRKEQQMDIEQRKLITESVKYVNNVMINIDNMLTGSNKMCCIYDNYEPTNWSNDIFETKLVNDKHKISPWQIKQFLSNKNDKEILTIGVLLFSPNSNVINA